jgi:hypothetical protein
VQDAAMQRAMTSSGCGMDACSGIGMRHAAARAVDLSLSAVKCHLFRQPAKGHLSGAMAVSQSLMLVLRFGFPACVCVSGWFGGLCRF